jgi:ubiquinone/menaquinone biosynthesis C-methylase UbiE
LDRPAVDPVAEGGFASAAGHYRRSRPTYAREAVGLLKERLPQGLVVDLAAGTGILTGQLRRAGREVVAVEPVPEMLAQMRLALPTVACLRAVAEVLPLRGGEVGAVTVAQAFHWFDAPKALAEIARVLAPGGVLAIVWNVRDESVPWVRALADLIEARSGGRPYTEDRGHPWEEVVEREGHYEHLDTHRFANPVPAGLESVLERVRSTSFVGVMPEREREALLAEIAEVLAADPEVGGRDHFDYPHHTVVQLFERRSR